jgi:hypothetical protein
MLDELRFQLPEKHKGRSSEHPLVETLTNAQQRSLVKAEDTRVSGLTYVAFDDNGFSVSQKKGPTQVAGPNHFHKENNPNEKVASRLYPALTIEASIDVCY